MKKAFISLILGSIVIFNTYAYAEDSTLKLEDALKMVDTSSTITLLDYGISKLNRAYDQIKDIAESIPIALQNGLDDQTKANMGLPFTKKDTLAQDKLVFIQPKQMFANYENLKETKKVTAITLKLKVEELYNGILLSDEGIKLSQEVFDASTASLNSGEDKYNKGLISKSDLEKIRIENTQNKLKLNIQKRSRQNLVYTLNKLLGMNMNSQYNLEGNFNDTLKFDFKASLDTYKRQAIENRLEIAKANKAIKIIEEEFFFTKAHYLPDEPQYIIDGIKLENEKENLNKLKEEIEYEIEDSYESIIQGYNDIEKAKITLENAKNKYDNLEEKYKAGLVTKDILDSSHIMVSSANLTLMSAVNKYNMSVKKFDAAVGMGPKFN